MRKIFSSMLLLICIRSFCQDQNLPSSSSISMDSLFKAKAKESIGKSFPAFTASFSGHTITKDSLKGKVILINFWFAACPPCVAELPALNKLYRELLPFKNFKFLSFTFEDTATLTLLKKKFKMLYNVTSVNRQECYRLNQNNGFPTSIILDGNGIIKYLYTGGTTNRKEAENFVGNTLHSDLLTEIVRQK